MDERSDQRTAREERLAARLRENLRRRKAQSRAIDAASADGTDKARGSGLSKDGRES